MQISSCSLKLPSTPDADYLPELLNTPDRDEIQSIHQYLKQQQNYHHNKPLSSIINKLPLSLSASTSAICSNKSGNVDCKYSSDNRKFVDFHQISSQATPRKTFGTPESSQTDSDDVSPQIQRKRKTTHARDILPRFSISIDDEHSRFVSCIKYLTWTLKVLIVFLQT